MGQQRWWEYRDDDATIRLDNWLLGALQPGRYCGFDLKITNNATLTLDHAKTGIKYSDKDNNLSAEVGALMSKTGVVVKEDEDITFTFLPNATSSRRIDTIYMQHRYKDGVEGGEQASYGYLPGTPGLSPSPPALTDESTQIVIGYLDVPPSTSIIDDTVNWIASKPPIPTTSRKGYNGQNKKLLEKNLSVNTSEISEFSYDGYSDIKLNLIVNNYSGTYKVYVTVDPNLEEANYAEFNLEIRNLVSGNFATKFNIDIYKRKSVGGFETIIGRGNSDEIFGVGAGYLSFTIKMNSNGPYVANEYKTAYHHKGRVNFSNFAPIYGLTYNAGSSSIIDIASNDSFPAYINSGAAELKGIRRSQNSTPPAQGTKILIEGTRGSGTKILDGSTDSSVGYYPFTLGRSDALLTEVPSRNAVFTRQPFVIAAGNVCTAVFSGSSWYILESTLSTRIDPIVSGLNRVYVDTQTINNRAVDGVRIFTENEGNKTGSTSLYRPDFDYPFAMGDANALVIIKGGASFGGDDGEQSMTISLKDGSRTIDSVKAQTQNGRGGATVMPFTLTATLFVNQQSDLDDLIVTWSEGGSSTYSDILEVKSNIIFLPR